MLNKDKICYLCFIILLTGVRPNCFYYFSTMGLTEAESLSALNEKSLAKIKYSWDLLLLQIGSKSLDGKG